MVNQGIIRVVVALAPGGFVHRRVDHVDLLLQEPRERLDVPGLRFDDHGEGLGPGVVLEDAPVQHLGLVLLLEGGAGLPGPPGATLGGPFPGAGQG